MKSAAIRTSVLFIGLPVALAWLFGASLLPLLAAYAAWLGVMLWGAREAGRKGKAKRVDPAAIAFMLFLFFGLPTALASVVATSWRTILIAYAIWFGLLGLFVLQGLMSRRVTTGEAVGWPIIAGMFLTMAAVPVLTLVLRLTGLA
jgi:hypothetical protein